MDWPGTLVERALQGEPLRLRWRPLEEPRRGTLVLLDSSASVVAGGMLAPAKGAVLGLVRQAQRRRERLQLICFGNDRVATIGERRLRRMSRARELLEEVTGGGGTPLAEAMQQALRWLRRNAQGEAQAWRLILFSDGRCSPPEGLHFDPEMLVVDTGRSLHPLRSRARLLARRLGADYLRPKWFSHDTAAYIKHSIG